MTQLRELCFVPFDSVVDTAFWHALSKRKLDDFRLEEGPFPITGDYTNGIAAGLSPRLNIGLSSLPNSGVISISRKNIHIVTGSLVTLNTLDEFKTIDKQAYIDKCGLMGIAASIASKNFIDKPNELLDFLLLTHCNLKSHKFYFWFAFPAVVNEHKPQIVLHKFINQVFTTDQIRLLGESYDTWRNHSSDVFFSVHESDDGNLQVCDFNKFNIKQTSNYVGFCDPSCDAEFPGWPLRNMLYAISTTIENEQVIKVICFRDRYSNEKRTTCHSLMLHLQIYPELLSTNESKFVGWERWNEKLQPRFICLSSTMNPIKLAESAVDLNLKLMLWRMLPDLNLHVLKRSRCLVLGSGTLGCNIARQLLGWGLRRITFVDNATVSYSNPVRQTLFTFEDAKESRPKAYAAAESLRCIFPSVEVEAFNLTIPMPGHPVSHKLMANKLLDPVNEAEQDVKQLEKLVCSHDIVFLLLDTREARWLPTLLSTYYGKITITAALGFDSYLVMRHGVARNVGCSPSKDMQTETFCLTPSTCGDNSKVEHVSGSHLGCYFCNDVVGPSNSLHDRTLDQQCTVTRPGTSMMAAALAVEMCVELLQHPDGGFASAEIKAFKHEETDHIGTFNFIPHQIRGYLSHFSQVLPCTTAFSHCSACSQAVLDAFSNNGFQFLLRVFDDADYLEDVSGLKQLQLESDLKDVLTLSESESE